MKDLAHAKNILDREITHNRIWGKLWLSPKTYMWAILKKFNILKTKVVKTLFAQHFKVSKLICPKMNEEITFMSKVSYVSGRLLDICYNLHICLIFHMSLVLLISRYMLNPKKQHWEVVKSIMQYLKCTSDMVFSTLNILVIVK